MAANSFKPSLRFLTLTHTPIFEQLQIEEALLRADEGNWCVLNQGTTPAIVMGISGNPELLINHALLNAAPIPVIRRFSGGGTVVVDSETCFVTFICNEKEVGITCCPKTVLQWTESFYRPLFGQLPFSLKENDYVLGNRKFGGNAQYFRKGRWLHHSSLLWDFSQTSMNYLLLPPKTPQYRENRSHADFLCKLHEHGVDREEWARNLEERLSECFTVSDASLKDLLEIKERPHRKATQLVF